VIPTVRLGRWRHAGLMRFVMLLYFAARFEIGIRDGLAVVEGLRRKEYLEPIALWVTADVALKGFLNRRMLANQSALSRRNATSLGLPRIRSTVVSQS